MRSPLFIGRKKELAQLKSIYELPTTSLVVVKGRRRIGKSRLIAEFAAQYPKQHFYSFAGLAPQVGITQQDQRNHFAQQLAQFTQLSPSSPQDWSEALEEMSRYLQSGDIILFDEISWMADQDPTFTPKLKAWWDKQRVPILLVLCGSVSTWIEENILNSTALFGRITLTLTLEPLTIPESYQFLKARQFKGSFYDTYQLLSVVGGIPWYLEQVRPGVTADELIKQLCLRKEGLLFLEFNRIFHDLFNGKSVIYKKILQSLKDGMKTLSELRHDIRFAKSGTLTTMIGHLITAGFVKKQTLWSFKTGKSLKQSLYHICDPYMRFYLKVIEAHYQQIEQDTFADVPFSAIPGIEGHMGLQLEYLLLQNRALLLKALGVNPIDIVCDGAYRQSATTKIPGCQIDYLVQTRTKNLFICEFKFKRRELTVEIIPEIEDKIRALKVPRGYAAVPVLFHLSDVSLAVYERDFFYRVIDIADFLANGDK